ncbi:MAG: type VI secretion system tip protein TssI/VgrG [Burkholderiaceae bacterium]|jgi:type VI secretion system secreted protein VgrG
MGRMLEISTKAGAGVFVVQKFSGREDLGRLYEYRLELLSERSDITAESLLGTNATVAMELNDSTSFRYFNGYITRFSVQGSVRTPAFKSAVGYLYLVTINPGLWFLTRAANSRIFNAMTINDIVMKELQSSSLITVENDVGSTEQRDFVVQYRETDFTFVSRLMEHAGIYYYFAHDNGSHTMVLLDQASKHKATPGLASLTFAGADREQTTLSEFVMVSEVQSGAYAVADYNYVMPNTQIASVSSDPKSHDNAGFEMFDFPADTSTASFAQTYAKIRSQENACSYQVAHGGGTERNIQVGFKIKLSDHPVAALNQEYVVIGHSFEAANNLADASGGTASFDCRFEAIPAATQFRSMRTVPRPVIAGTQTALVVADFRTDTDSSGGTDPVGANLGRVKVRFFWDRYASDSCWARVSTPWAGKGYGFQNMPRIGEEVLVQFLEGDPDRPVVIGRVHNAENMPPFKLPAGANYSGLKSLSIDPGGKSVAGKWNELRFDDTDGAEQIYLQAQFNLDKRVLNDDKTWIGNESHHYVKSDAFAKFDADHHVQTTGDHNEKIGGKLSFDVKSDIHVKSGTMFVVDGGQEVHLKASSKIVLESPMMVSLVCGGNFVTVGPSGVDIKGIMVNVNSGGSKGSGSAISPQAPKDHKEAMKSDGGSATKVPAPPPAPTAFSPKASSFIIAANTAAPFVSSSCPG